MKRLLMVMTLLSCGEQSTPAPSPSRVEAVTAKPLSLSAAELCDKVPSAGTAKFAFPVVEGSPPTRKGPLWVNVWATWCPPCVDELPIVRKLEAALVKRGAPMTLSLLSVDTDAEAVAKFEAAHPEVKGSLRLKDDKQLEPWLLSIGLDRGATLPVHVFVRTDGQIACVRTGAIKESDLPAIASLLNP
ncbi:MAG TPA: TlpA disulfide reductase family protein [Polyangiales bacterium]